MIPPFYARSIEEARFVFLSSYLPSDFYKALMSGDFTEITPKLENLRVIEVSVNTIAEDLRATQQPAY